MKKKSAVFIFCEGEIKSMKHCFQNAGKIWDILLPCCNVLVGRVEECTLLRQYGWHNHKMDLLKERILEIVFTMFEVFSFLWLTNSLNLHSILLTQFFITRRARQYWNRKITIQFIVQHSQDNIALSLCLNLYSRT